jgi:hypothetical protein
VARFSACERRALLLEPGIDARVIDRLEQAGYGSVRQLYEVGVSRVVDQVCRALATRAWRNRQRPLHRAVARILAQEGEVMACRRCGADGPRCTRAA